MKLSPTQTNVLESLAREERWGTWKLEATTHRFENHGWMDDYISAFLELSNDESHYISERRYMLASTYRALLRHGLIEQVHCHETAWNDQLDGSRDKDERRVYRISKAGRAVLEEAK
jgi:hypothetical protein